MSTRETPAISYAPQKSFSVLSASARLVALRLEAEKREIVRLENERERLRERGVRHAREKRVIDVVQREHLLDVVAELVDGDIESLVIHPARADARAQMRLGPAHSGARRMPRAARGIDRDVPRDVRRSLLRKAELHENIRNVLLERLRMSDISAQTILSSSSWE